MPGPAKMERREENGGLRPARRSVTKNTGADGMETEKMKQDRVAVINSLSSNLPAVLNNPSKGSSDLKIFLSPQKKVDLLNRCCRQTT